MYSLLIQQATVIDGTGKPGQVLDVAIEGDSIVTMAPHISSSAQAVFDARGLVLTPGFVDIQNHSDGYWQLFNNPSLDSLVTQGFTTILVGNCGASLAPLLSKHALLAIQKWHSLEGLNSNWQSFDEYLRELEKKKYGCNIASLVGYSTLRRGILGDQVRAVRPEEMAVLEKALEASLTQGAFGLSSGLSYSHELAATKAELVEIAKLVKAHNGLLSLHLRNESTEVIEALEEALDIARETGVNLKISHLKVRNKKNWFKLEEVRAILETAYHRGVNVHFDVYPYDTVWQVLYSYLPPWAVEGGRQKLVQQFNDPVTRKKIVDFLNNSEVKIADLFIASTTNRLNVAGKTISQIAKNLEVTSEQALLHLVQNGGSEVLAFEKNLSYEQVTELVKHPLSMVATDGGGFPAIGENNLVHPRCFGTAPKFLKEVIGSKIMPLEHAIMKLTSIPARKVGLHKRGVIAVGNFADLVLFDPTRVQDAATYENPYQPAGGLSCVFVNGQPTVVGGQVTNSLSGRVLRKKA